MKPRWQYHRAEVTKTNDEDDENAGFRQRFSGLQEKELRITRPLRRGYPLDYIQDWKVSKITGRKV